ncbi:hypothetical protein BDN71DRAFT_1432574 [Pleurotus eryngii]|uniref:Uncharacterized protein n=1 Tax=Pleurotus eryngii TaxID=5323 RepID=A0A9P5ZV86_PLEER|nr:hypothetical protein BDN71DRAFT_1432574 [Pleurotus eryngii]
MNKLGQGMGPAIPLLWLLLRMIHFVQPNKIHKGLFADDPDDVQALPVEDNLLLALPHAPLSESIEDITHANHLALQAEMTQGKGTELVYPYQVNSYMNYLMSNDATLLTTVGPVQVFPITATKVALYLEYVTKQCKTRDGVEIPGTTLGWESIKQIVSALESHCKNHQHKDIYHQCPKSQIPLWNDIQIQVYEKASKVTDTQKKAESQCMKAMGAIPIPMMNLSEDRCGSYEAWAPQSFKSILAFMTMQCSSCFMLFPGNDGDLTEMLYENHRRRVNIMKEQNNISINKVTHAGCPYAATTACEHQASRDNTKDLSGWIWHQTLEKKGKDIALKNFLEFLIHDAAILSVKYPDCGLFKFAPFDTPTFWWWAMMTVNIIQMAEEESCLQLQSFPPHVATSLQGIFEKANLHHYQVLAEMQSNQN